MSHQTPPSVGVEEEDDVGSGAGGGDGDFLNDLVGERQGEMKVEMEMEMEMEVVGMMGSVGDHDRCMYRGVNGGARSGTWVSDMSLTFYSRPEVVFSVTRTMAMAG